MKIPYMRTRVSIITAIIFFIALISSLIDAKKVYGDDLAETTQLVEKARFTLENFYKAREMEGFRGLAKKARGIFIAPQILKGAIIFGASGGSGVLVVHDKKTETWKGPAFYTIGEASFGLQIGGEAAEIVMLIMSERGISAMLSSSIKLGADIGIAMGPVGVGIDASTANISADIITFAMSKGVYGGISLEGAFIKARHDWNKAYYGKDVLPSDIIMENSVKNPHSNVLIKMVKTIVEAR
ncbi:MAG: lipid-binding SYLF domain-containing protein [Syntrophorhabdaceae bacterium]|nr:lipid-binding SYLF domain-containing protein [Syntrophorhabdales bacterium]MBP9560967.1 lipid-binding SYLF domain-containing protein [Syntrophorhabdaceae bacterium]